MRRIIAAAACLLLGGAAAQADEPVDTVRTLMQLETWAITAVDPGADRPFSDYSLGTYFTDAFADAFAAVRAKEQELDLPLIDGDVIIGSQEYCPLRDVFIAPGEVAEGRAEVRVTFQAQWCYPEAGDAVSGHTTEVTFHLVEVDARWLVDDFAVDTDESFRSVMESLLDEDPAQ